MKLNHLNLTVTDNRTTTKFLVKYFGMRNMSANRGMGFLTDSEGEWGFVLSLTKAGEKPQNRFVINGNAFIFAEP